MSLVYVTDSDAAKHLKVRRETVRSWLNWGFLKGKVTRETYVERYYFVLRSALGEKASHLTGRYITAYQAKRLLRTSHNKIEGFIKRGELPGRVKAVKRVRESYLISVASMRKVRERKCAVCGRKFLAKHLTRAHTCSDAHAMIYYRQRHPRRRA